MKFWKILLALVISTLYLLVLSTAIATAQNEFLVDSNVSYRVQDGGRTLVIHDITLENNFSTLYATTYSLSLKNIDAQNIRAYSEKGLAYTADTEVNGDETDIKITFSDAVVGKGAKRHFFISYENGSFAVKTGEVWEISIPKLSDATTFRKYSVTLFVPAAFGLEAYISPKPRTSQISSEGKTYTFDKSSVVQTGITAGFGQFQVFSFNLLYHLENPLAKSATTEIALPPDTAFQKIYFSKIEPRPTQVAVDGDGNWLASYKLSARQRVDVTVAGSVQIFSGFRPFPKPGQQELSENLKETQFWQVNDPQIKALAKELKTPKAIYDYVTGKLSYDYSRVQPNVQRFGAVKALQNPSQAICMEYTDLFIAIARAAGIPAREINGYAYTENPQLQPLSLVADVLHSWPEYYDSQKGVWIPVDPTWGSTTGGVDYFTKLDLRHFTFVIHGADSSKPYPPGSYKLGPNPQKDVFVNFGKLPAERTSVPALSADVKRNIPFLDLIYSITVANPGPAALYSLYPTIFFDGKEQNRDFIEVLPPYAHYNFSVIVPFSILGNKTPDTVRVVIDASQITIPTNKSAVVTNSLLALFLLFLLFVLGMLVKLKKITFRRLTATISSIKTKYGRFGSKTQKNSDSKGPV